MLGTISKDYRPFGSREGHIRGYRLLKGTLVMLNILRVTLLSNFFPIKMRHGTMYFPSELKSLWILITWLQQKPTDLDQQLFKKDKSGLTHLSRMDSPTLIRRTNPFTNLGVLGGILCLFSNSNRTLCKQILDTMIRRRLVRRLIWVCNVCLCPTKRTLVFNRLSRTLVCRV